MIPPAGAGLDEGSPQATEHWRRWFSGKASWHEGSELPASPRMAVVVLGFMAQPGLVAAVESLLDQNEETELVVVNSGGGTPETLLAAVRSKLRIINIRQPLYVGAARNIGIDASSAPYIAFLAGDCRARPEWILGRLKAHEEGAAAVASAIVPADGHDDLALAAHLCLFGPRSPEVPPAQALRYGASYKRRVFETFGYFNPALRTGEDTEFAKRLTRRVYPAWDPTIQTEHTGPAHLPGFMADMFGRGRRAARHNRAASEQPSRTALSNLIANAGARTEAALRIGREILNLDDQRLSAIRRHILLGSIAHAAGLSVGRARLRKARRYYARSLALRERGHIARATREAQRAVGQDQETLAFRLGLAELLLAQQGVGREADAHIDVAMWLSAFNGDRLVAMVDWLVAMHLHDKAFALVERATFCLPAPMRDRELDAIRRKLEDIRLPPPQDEPQPASSR